MNHLNSILEKMRNRIKNLRGVFYIHKLFNDRTGEIKINNQGTEMKIIRYGGCSDIDVEFLDDHHYIKKGNSYVNFKKGNIFNPYDKTAYGVGYLGVGRFKTVECDNPHKSTTVDRAWRNMLRRCYYAKTSNEFPTYYGICTVCDEWHDFQNFAEWYENNYIEVKGRLHIDKDILYPGNKEYSPEKCMLVPQRINMLFVNHPNDSGLPSGITKVKNDRFKAEYNAKQLGYYTTFKEAFVSYKKAKEEAIKRIAEDYKTIISEKLYYALINYEVLLENDTNYNVG